MNNVTRLFNYHTNFNFNCLNNTYINNISKFYINNIINKQIFINKKFINKTYSYDKNGNIILKDGVNLSYDTTIKDRLISIGEDTITYNSTNVLLPNTYRNNRLEFEGKRLIRFITNSQHYDYEYDDSGI